MKRIRFWTQIFFNVSDVELGHFISCHVEFQSVSASITFCDVPFYNNIENYSLPYLHHLWKNNGRSDKSHCTKVFNFFISLWCRTFFSVWTCFKQKLAATKINFGKGSINVFGSQFSASFLIMIVINWNNLFFYSTHTHSGNQKTK